MITRETTPTTIDRGLRPTKFELAVGSFFLKLFRPIVANVYWAFTIRRNKRLLEQQQSDERWKIIRLHQWTKRMTKDEAVKFGIEQRALIEGGGIGKHDEWDRLKQILSQAERGMISIVPRENHKMDGTMFIEADGRQYFFRTKRTQIIPDRGSYK